MVNPLYGTTCLIRAKYNKDLPWLVATLKKQYGVYFESQRSPIISYSYFFCSYQGLKKGPSDPEADDIPMCQYASLIQNN